MRIAIGSTNPVKCSATRAVLTPLFPGAEYVCQEVPSGVAALEQTGADLAVGLEGGVQDSEFGLLTAAWCVVVDRHGRIGVGGNSCAMLPPAVAGELRQGLELGAAMDHLVRQHNTKHQNGAIGILTNNLETRQSAYETIIRLALAPFQNPAWYPVSSNP
jgi:non-canonical (house-cleaning) NTP pyrophosphatase